MSYITKKKIANACKDLVVKTDIDQVSVTKIMKSINMRRQTFYDFFLDKYDAIEWLYNDEITEIIEDNLDYEKWHNIVNYLCIYFFKNRNFFRKILNDSNQSNFSEKLIEKHIQNLVKVIMLEISDKQKIQFSDNQIEFSTELFANSLVGQLKTWISNHHRRSVEDESKFLTLFIEDTINGMLLREKPGRHKYHYFD
ncbi:dihydroxyacetone kinase transcriptional activator DhaS [Companilactobacillus sp. DQM5]|uniref:dihydroxyacetone kinase transcriptional activator DhaS n=1 Tax=Companilactobacillus sp. DQM5 TaxID=3463359 RepID=UPI004059884D